MARRAAQNSCCGEAVTGVHRKLFLCTIQAPGDIVAFERGGAPSLAAFVCVMLTLCALVPPAASPPLRHALQPSRETLHCVSTAVDTKSAWCEEVCRGEAAACPLSACLCVAADGSARAAHLSRTVLRRLATRLRATPAAEKSAKLQAARKMAARAVTTLSMKQGKGPLAGGKTCTSIKDGITDDWCDVACRSLRRSRRRRSASPQGGGPLGRPRRSSWPGRRLTGLLRQYTVRKQHNQGWKHKSNVREYYSQYLDGAMGGPRPPTAPPRESTRLAPD